MAILVSENTRAICQGMTGRQGSFHAEQAIAYGTQIVAGVTPGKGGTRHLALPVYDSVKEAVAETKADASVLFVPPDSAAAAIIEAIEAGVPLIVCVTERIPTLDMVRVRRALEDGTSILVGSNSPGVIAPEACKLGIMPGHMHRRGRVGIISRSGTLTYEAAQQTSQLGLGQSTVVGIGGDMLHGLSITDCLQRFLDDPQTEAILILGEIGGQEEEDAAVFLADRRAGKPVAAYIAGRTAPAGRRVGHQGAIIEDGVGGAAHKITALREAGVAIAPSVTALGATVRKALG